MEILLNDCREFPINVEILNWNFEDAGISQDSLTTISWKQVHSHRYQFLQLKHLERDLQP